MYLHKNFIYLKQKNELRFRDIHQAAGIGLSTLNLLAQKQTDQVTIRTVMQLSIYFKISIDKLIWTDLEKDGWEVSKCI